MKYKELKHFLNDSVILKLIVGPSNIVNKERPVLKSTKAELIIGTVVTRNGQEELWPSTFAWPLSGKVTVNTKNNTFSIHNPNDDNIARTYLILNKKLLDYERL
jgi:hypothetical protein